MDNKKWLAPVSLTAAGVVAGAVLAGALSANAATPSPSPSTSGGSTAEAPDHDGDRSKPQRSVEKLLTGTTKSKVEAAVKAKHPTATILRTETDSNGVYESHVQLADGSEAVVMVGKDFTVTGTEQHGHGGGHGTGDRDRDGRGAPDATG